MARWHIYNKEWWRSSAPCRPHPAASPSAGTHGNGRCRVKSTLHRPLGCSSPPAREWRKQRLKGLALAVYFVGNGQFLAALGTTSGQYAATISRLHALTETMFVVSLAVVGLECSFHCVYAVFCLLSWASRTAGTGGAGYRCRRAKRGLFNLRGAKVCKLFEMSQGFGMISMPLGARTRRGERAGGLYRAKRLLCSAMSSASSK